MNPTLHERSHALYIARNWRRSKDPEKYAKRRKIKPGSLADLYAAALSSTTGACIADHDRQADNLLSRQMNWEPLNAERDARLADLMARIG